MWKELLSGFAGDIIGGFIVAFFETRKERFLLIAKWMAALREEIGGFIASSENLRMTSTHNVNHTFWAKHANNSVLATTLLQKIKDDLDLRADFIAKMNRVKLLLKDKGKQNKSTLSENDEMEQKLEDKLDELFKEIDKINPQGSTKCVKIQDEVVAIARHLLYLNWLKVKRGLTFEGWLYGIDTWLKEH